MTTHKDALRKAHKVEEVTIVGFLHSNDEHDPYLSLNRDSSADHVDALMTVAQHERILEALAAQPEQQLVAQVESWTNGSYHRNYKLHWFLDVPEGTKLYASPIETAANEGWISVSNGLPEKGLYIVNSTWGVRPAFKHDPAWADCFQDALTHSDEGMGHPDEKGPFRVIQYMRLPAAPQPPQENKE